MNVVRRFFRICWIVGICLLLGAAISVRHTMRFLSAASTAPGVVVANIPSALGDANTTYYPQVRFRTAAGQDILFTSNAGSYPPSFHENQSVTIVYDPTRPQHAYIQSVWDLWLAAILLGILGVACCSIPAGGALWQRRTGQKKAWLQQNGRRIQAELLRVELNQSTEVSGASPFRLVCQWRDPATQQTHVFYSANIWYDPSEFIPGKTLEVLLDPQNPRRYAVETPFLK